jgi:hypothetical protein
MNERIMVDSEIVVDLLINAIDELEESDVILIEGFPKNKS